MKDVISRWLTNVCQGRSVKEDKQDACQSKIVVSKSVSSHER